MGIVDKFFHRPVACPISPSIDTEHLDRSLQLLKTTTAEVSQAAVSAAQALEAKLQYSEFRFYSTIDAISDLVVVKDAAGRWKTVNSTAQRMFGWVHGEYYDKTDDELRALYPKHSKLFDLCKKTDQMVWESKKQYRYEMEVDNHVGTHYLDVVKTPIFNTDGTPKELIIVGRDNTETYEKQRRMKACFSALNSASDAIAIVDGTCRVFFCNDQFVRRFEVEDYNNCVGERLVDVIPCFNRYEEMWRTVQTNTSWEGEYSDGHHVSVFPMMNGLPKPIYYVFTFKNVHNHK